MNETEIAKENVKGCSKKGLGIIGFKCGYYRGTFCDECSTKINTHFASCQRFLEFLEALNLGNAVNQMFKRDDKVTFKFIKEKIKDLQQAIKIYEDARIKC